MSDPRTPSGRYATFDEEFEEETTSVSMPPTLDGRRAKEILEPQARDRATLTIVTGFSAGAIHSLVEENLIGRGKECGVRIDDPGISRRHARVVRRGPGAYFVEDLGSRNGTFVGGKQVVNHRLEEGDRIQVGPTLELRFGIVDEAEEKLLRGLYESSVLDPLTGAFNRKHFGDRLSGEIAYAGRHKAQLSLLMFDLDHFKRVNDTLGHLGGDHVLRTVAGIVKKTLRVEDVFARYGGEEFAIIARGTDVERAHALAERIRTIVERSKIDYGGVLVPVTVSVGAASLACSGSFTDGELLIAKADERLYAAKRAGRNRSVGA
ncbi:MAG TPA: GGDEF domain-containing protein [Polyangiaceae bacterium]|nr:GGDEF domain-containing protein [Polyangiaceae bacterium]